MIKKALIILTLLQLVISTSFAQVTYKPHVESQNNNCIIEKVELTENSTIVTIKVPSSKRRGDWVRISSNTYYYQSGEFDPKHFYIFYNGNIPNLKRIGLSDYDIHQMIMNSARKDFPFSFIRSLGNDQLDTQYRIYNATETYYTFTMYFSRIDVGEEVFSIVEDLGWYWCGIKINNPFPKVANVGLNEHEVKQNINENNDGICGIYEDLNDDYKLACIKKMESMFWFIWEVIIPFLI